MSLRYPRRPTVPPVSLSSRHRPSLPTPQAPLPLQDPGRPIPHRRHLPTGRPHALAGASLGGACALRRADRDFFESGRGVVDGDPLHRQLILEATQDISSSLDLLELERRVRLNEVVDVHEAASDSHLYLVALFDFDVDTLLPELVDALGLPEEENVHLLFLRVPLNVLGEVHVNLVTFVADVDVVEEVVALRHQVFDLLLGSL